MIHEHSFAHLRASRAGAEGQPAASHALRTTGPAQASDTTLREPPAAPAPPRHCSGRACSDARSARRRRRRHSTISEAWSAPAAAARGLRLRFAVPRRHVTCSAAGAALGAAAESRLAERPAERARGGCSGPAAARGPRRRPARQLLWNDPTVTASARAAGGPRRHGQVTVRREASRARGGLLGAALRALQATEERVVRARHAMYGRKSAGQSETKVFRGERWIYMNVLLGCNVKRSAS